MAGFQTGDELVEQLLSGQGLGVIPRPQPYDAVREAMSPRLMQKKKLEMARMAADSLRGMQKEAGVGYLYTPQGRRVSTDNEATQAIASRIKRQGVDDAERLAGLSVLRDAEARMPGPAWGSDTSQIPIDRDLVNKAMQQQGLNEYLTLNPGMARHLSPVGREQPAPVATMDQRQALLQGRGMPWDAPGMNAADHGKYTPGQPLRDSKTQVELNSSGNIRLVGPKRDMMKLGDKEMTRAAYNAKSKAGIKDIREKRAARRKEAAQSAVQLANQAMGSDDPMVKASMVANSLLRQGAPLAIASKHASEVFEAAERKQEQTRAFAEAKSRDSEQRAFELQKQSELLASQGKMKEAEIAANAAVQEKRAAHEFALEGQRDKNAIALEGLRNENETTRQGKDQEFRRGLHSEELGFKLAQDKFDKQFQAGESEKDRGANKDDNKAKAELEKFKAQLQIAGGLIGSEIPEEKKRGMAMLGKLMPEMAHPTGVGQIPSYTTMLEGDEADKEIKNLIANYDRPELYDSPEEIAAIRETAREKGLSDKELLRYMEENRRSTWADAGRPWDIMRYMKNPTDLINPWVQLTQTPRSLYNVYDRLANEPTDDMENLIRALTRR